MLMQIIVLLLIAAIAYFHYVEGFFSASLSAILAMIAAMGAFSLHEPVAQLMIGQKFLPDDAQSISLVVLFGLMYFLPRLAFDNLVSGNVRLPLLVDKIGSAVLGLFAGVMVLGTMAIALQELPFGATVAGYGRYAVLPDRQVAMIPPGGSNTSNFTISDEVAETVLGSDWGVSAAHPMHHVCTPVEADRWATKIPPQSSLAIPVDDMVIAMVSAASQGGLGGDQVLRQLHPDFLLELFAQRLGIESGQRHTASNPACTVSTVFLPTESIPVMDDFPDAMRTNSAGNDPPLPVLTSPIKSSDECKVLVVRTSISDPNGDEDADKIMRLSTSSVRLCMPVGATWADFYPEGTLLHAGGTLLLWNKPSDPLFLDFSGGNKPKIVDWVYLVPADAIREKKLPAGTFLEFKRNATANLDQGVKIADAIDSAEDGLLRDKWFQESLDRLRTKPPAPTPPASGKPAPTGAQPPAPSGSQAPAGPIPDLKNRVAPAMTGGNGI